MPETLAPDTTHSSMYTFASLLIPVLLSSILFFAAPSTDLSAATHEITPRLSVQYLASCNHDLHTRAACGCRLLQLDTLLQSGEVSTDQFRQNLLKLAVARGPADIEDHLASCDTATTNG